MNPKEALQTLVDELPKNGACPNPCKVCDAIDVLTDELNRRAFDAQPEPAAPTVVEPARWEGGEGWESLAWELCADENGENACAELVWEGGAIPEPWGDRWMKYEGEAKRLIALVHKYAATPPRAALTELRRMQIIGDEFPLALVDPLVIAKVDAVCLAIEAAHGIGGPLNE
jgi:hypothetical protein